MVKDPTRLHVAIADPSVFGQAMVSDLLADERVRNIAKFSQGRDLLAAMRDTPFDLIVVDDEFPAFSVAEIMAIAQWSAWEKPQFIALQSSLSRDSVQFLRARGIGGVLLKPVAPKRFSHIFRSIFTAQPAAILAA